MGAWVEGRLIGELTGSGEKTISREKRGIPVSRVPRTSSLPWHQTWARDPGTAITRSAQDLVEDRE